MEEERWSRARRSRGPEPLARTIRLPLVLAVALAGALSVVSRFLPGTTIGWETWLTSHTGLVAPVILTLIVAGAVLSIATRCRSRGKRRWYLARNYLRGMRWRRRWIAPAAVLGAVEPAGDVNAFELGQLADWPLSVAKIILLTGALGMVLRLMHYFESYAMLAGAQEGTQEDIVLIGWSMCPVAFALVAVIPITVLSAILKRRTERRVAEVRAVARVLAEHAAERAAGSRAARPTE